MKPVASIHRVGEIGRIFYDKRNGAASYAAAHSNIYVSPRDHRDRLVDFIAGDVTQATEFFRRDPSKWGLIRNARLSSSPLYFRINSV